MTDPEFRPIDLICNPAQKSPDKAEFADLEHIARRVADSTRK